MTTAEPSRSPQVETHDPEMTGRKWDILALGIFGVAHFAYFSPLILAKGALFYFDVTEINYAYRHYFAESLKSGRLAFWCHRLYNGLPLFAESQAGYFHPLKYIFYPWMSTWAALGYDMAASLALTGLGTYFWLRPHAHPAGALCGALISVFGGFTWAHFVHTSMVNALAAVPWIIWGVERSWRTGRFGGSAVAAFALATQVFAGHLQDALMSIQLVGLISIYALIVTTPGGSRRRIVIHGMVVMAFGVAIASVQWMPSYDLLKRTPRTEGLTWLDQTFGSWHPQLLPTLFVREAYGTRARDTDWMDGFYPYHEVNTYLGATAMLLALVGMRRWRDPWVGLWVFIGFISAIFMLGRFTFVMDFWHRVPILGSSRIPVRYHLWATFATAALASQGLDMLIRRREDVKLKKPVAFLGMIALIAAGIFAWGMTPWWTESGRWTAAYHQERNRWLTEDLIYGTVRSSVLFLAAILSFRIAAGFESVKLRTMTGYVLAAIVGCDLISAHWHEMPTVDPAFWTQPPAAAGVVRSDPKASRVMGIARYSAGEPGYASKPIDFFAPRDALGWSLPLAYGLESNVGETPFRPARLIRLTDLSGGEPWRFAIEGVTHLVTGQAMNANMKPVPAGSAFVYRLPDPEPRFHWAREVRIVADQAVAEATLKSLGAANTTDVLVVESGDSPQNNPVGGDWTAGIRTVEYGGDRMTFDLESAAPQWLRLGVSYDPGWRAWVDGQELNVSPAQLAFMAVPIPAGKHRLEMRYWPVHFRLGGILTIAALASLTVLVVFCRNPKNEDETFRPDRPTPKIFAPYVLILTIFALLAVSAIGFGRDGKIGLSSRWNDSWHRFTWGAGIEAMNRK
ncbi:YfhO family protein [bacterium]|nr:YfhO family protein [bacterium]